MFSEEALNKLLADYKFETVLDIGSGSGVHADIFRRNGKFVIPIDWKDGVRYETMQLSEPVDCIWASHVLEHMHDVGFALDKMRHDLRPGGVLAVTVPPLKHEIVGGHVSLWNAGLLLYRLILAGFDCSQAAVRSSGYNVSVIVRRKDARLPELAHDAGDIERLAHLFPMPVAQGFDGRIESVNW